MYGKRKVSLVFPAYNEEKSIGRVLSDFSKVKEIDEIVVVDNNSTDGTTRIAKRYGKVKLVGEKRQGYGYAIQKGLSVATGDVLVLCDADGTYVARDIKRLLKESPKYDFVFATRVQKRYILRGSNMGLIRRLANIVLSKLIQVLFSGPSLTDLGATFRLLNRKPYERIKKYFRVGGGHFQPELTILALLFGFSIKEVPVCYGARIGTSKISGSFTGGIKTARGMTGVILSYRFLSWLGRLPKRNI